MGLRGATVARLTPDQKAACSNHVGVNLSFSFEYIMIESHAGLKLSVGLINIHQPSFLSVVVITSALHAEGRRFEPGRKQRSWLVGLVV